MAGFQATLAKLEAGHPLEVVVEEEEGEERRWTVFVDIVTVQPQAMVGF